MQIVSFCGRVITEPLLEQYKGENEFNSASCMLEIVDGKDIIQIKIKANFASANWLMTCKINDYIIGLGKLIIKNSDIFIRINRGERIFYKEEKVEEREEIINPFKLDKLPY